MLEEESSAPDKAGWSALQAVWVCDDSEAIVAATECRGRAARLFFAARDRQLSLAGQAGGEVAILADVLRRSGDHERARQLSQTGLKLELPEVIRKVMEYQVALAERRDIRCYTIEDALSHAGEA